MTLKLLFKVILVAAFVSNSAIASSVKFVGTAYELESGKVLYTEHHDLTIALDGSVERGSVKYFSSGKKLIAEKVLVYGDLPTMPELEFFDHRTETRYQTSNIRHESGMNILLQYLSKEGSGQKVLDVSKTIPSVTDAGFEILVANNWDVLNKGETVYFRFLALSRADYYDFQLSKVSQGEELLVLQLAPSSWLVSLLMDPIILTYSTQNRRLLKFEGLTNIEEVIDGNITGKNYSARIEYLYVTENVDAGAKL